MSNTSNYIKCIENMQQICNKPHLYKITNQINGKYYYGIHNGTNTQNYDGSGILLHQAYEKHGKENFKKEILMWFDTEEEAYEYEAVVVNEKMINKNNPMCYNLCIGGHGGDTNSGKKVIYNENGEYKYIYPEFIEEFLKNGWKLGFHDETRNLLKLIGSQRYENGTHPFYLLTDEQKFENSSKGGFASTKKQIENNSLSFLNFTEEERTEYATLGGNACFEKHGINHYSEMGILGVKSSLEKNGCYGWDNMTPQQKLEARQKGTKNAIDNGNHVSCQNYKCEWCGKELKKGDSRNYFKWHGDNCKLNPNSSRYKK